MSELKIERPTRSREARAIASVQNDSETIRMSVIMDKKFHNRLKVIAIGMNMDLSTLVRQALNEYISKHASGKM